MVQLIVPTEVAHDAVYELGELGNVQFKDVGDMKSILLRLTVLTYLKAEPGRQPLSTFVCRRDPSHRRNGQTCTLFRKPTRIGERSYSSTASLRISVVNDYRWPSRATDYRRTRRSPRRARKTDAPDERKPEDLRRAPQRASRSKASSAEDRCIFREGE